MGNPTVGDLYLRRYKTVDIPMTTEDEIQSFLMEVYQEKDELIDSYMKTGGKSFTAHNNLKNFSVSTWSFI